MEDEPEGTALVTPMPVTSSRAHSLMPVRAVKAAQSTASRDERWQRYTRYARWLAWATLAGMTADGTVGLVAGITAGSIALTGWALGSVVEGWPAFIVVWRFTGPRTML